jgi:hypothetical protein
MTQTGAVIEAAVGEEASDIENNLRVCLRREEQIFALHHIICRRLSTVGQAVARCLRAKGLPSPLVLAIAFFTFASPIFRK